LEQLLLLSYDDDALVLISLLLFYDDGALEQLLLLFYDDGALVLMLLFYDDGALVLMLLFYDDGALELPSLLFFFFLPQFLLASVFCSGNHRRTLSSIVADEVHIVIK
jgi:hypothetical protein